MIISHPNKKKRSRSGSPKLTDGGGTARETNREITNEGLVQTLKHGPIVLGTLIVGHGPEETVTLLPPHRADPGLPYHDLTCLARRPWTHLAATTDQQAPLAQTVREAIALQVGRMDPRQPSRPQLGQPLIFPLRLTLKILNESAAADLRAHTGVLQIQMELEAPYDHIALVQDLARNGLLKRAIECWFIHCKL